MTRLLGTGEGNTVVILTDKESALIRSLLGDLLLFGNSEGIDAFNRGVARGTERIKTEFAELQKARKAGPK